jgi:hypothetical protein
MGISTVFDINRVTNLENRLDVDESIMIATDDTAQQTIPSIASTTVAVTGAASAATMNITGANNSLVQTAPNTTTQWLGGMLDPNTYKWTFGCFHAGKNDVELRSYTDYLAIRTGRSAAAINADLDIYLNDLNSTAAGLTNNMNITFNAGGGKVICNSSFQGTAFNVSSSEEYKQDIKDFDGDALSLIKKTKVKKYKRKEEPDRERIGLIQEEAPAELQTTAFSKITDKEEKYIDMYHMCSVLWAAVQQLSDQVQQLKGAAAK